VVRALFLVPALILLASCDRTPPGTPQADKAAELGDGKGDTHWLLGPEPSADLVHADASEASLRAEFGAAFVRPDSVYVGEGLSEFGTILFPGDSARELSIIWEDTLERARPRYVYLTGSNSMWRLYPGVGIGTDLKTLESLNGGPFQLAGFGWDYSGTTASFNGGRLDSLWRRDTVLGGAALLRLDPQTAGAPDSLAAQVEGDRLFSSDHPAMRLLNPRIYQILVHPR
jgi:hypothetical protein